jgi:multicomponent Na+:H+ antiporter subunit G
VSEVSLFSMIMDLWRYSVLIGLTFVFLGMLGLIRLPDVYTVCIQLPRWYSWCLRCNVEHSHESGFTPIGVKAIALSVLLLTALCSSHDHKKGGSRHGVGLCKESVIDEYGKACERCKNKHFLTFYKLLSSLLITHQRRYTFDWEH